MSANSSPRATQRRAQRAATPVAPKPAPAPPVREVRIPLEPQQAAMLGRRTMQIQQLQAEVNEMVVFAASGAKVVGDIRGFELSGDAAGSPVLVLQVAPPVNDPGTPPGT